MIILREWCCLKILKGFIVDNGEKFAVHIELVQNTGMKVFFCDLYLPWHR